MELACNKSAAAKSMYELQNLRRLISRQLEVIRQENPKKIKSLKHMHVVTTTKPIPVGFTRRKKTQIRPIERP